MNQQNEIRIADFQFQSIRQYMLPLYWELRHVENQSDEAKRITISKTYREFFGRLRKFRYITVEEMAEALKTSVSEIESFEAGTEKSEKLQYAYCEKCHGWFELAYLERRIKECLHPETRDSKKQMAKEVWKRHGVLIPDVDFARLNSAPGDVIAIRQKTNQES